MIKAGKGEKGMKDEEWEDSICLGEYWCNCPSCINNNGNHEHMELNLSFADSYLIEWF